MIEARKPSMSSDADETSVDEFEADQNPVDRRMFAKMYFAEQQESPKTVLESSADDRILQVV